MEMMKRGVEMMMRLLSSLASLRARAKKSTRPSLELTLLLAPAPAPAHKSLLLQTRPPDSSLPASSCIF